MKYIHPNFAFYTKRIYIFLGVENNIEKYVIFSVKQKFSVESPKIKVANHFHQIFKLANNFYYLTYIIDDTIHSGAPVVTYNILKCEIS